MTIRLAFSGPIGAGKTTLAEMLCKYDDVHLVPEWLPTELFENFRHHPKKFCYEVQRKIVAFRVDSIITAPKVSLLALHRMIEEDREVFFELHKRLGYLNNKQIQSLIRFSKHAESKVGKADAVVFMTARPNILRKRVQDKRHPRFLLESLELLCRLYDDWLARMSLPRVVIDTSSLSLNTMRDIAEWIYQTVPKLNVPSFFYCGKANLLWTKCARGE